MKKTLSLLLLLSGFGPAVHAQEIPEDRVAWDSPAFVTPGEHFFTTAPSDAIILFDGEDASEFVSRYSGDPIRWTVADGCMTVSPKGGDIVTKRTFRDFQLHIEWRAPAGEEKEDGFRGNSGVILQGKYEIQVLESYRDDYDPKCQAGSLYNQRPPLVNASAPAGEWNAFDIIYTAPTFKEDGTYRTYPYVTVLHNGVLIHNHVQIPGITYSDYQGYASGDGHGDGPIMLQDHQSAVSYRNIWIREL